MNNNKKQNDYDQFIKTLSQLDVEELILLYIEAKTGDQRNIDQIPVSILNAINDLGDQLNIIYADQVINGLFRTDE